MTIDNDSIAALSRALIPAALDLRYGVQPMIDDPTRPFDTETSENGQRPMPTPILAKAGRNLPGRREVSITMPGDYGDVGLRLKIWANYPHKLANQIASGDEEQTAASLAQIVLWHNDWCDDDGTPLPPLKPASPGAKEGEDDFEDARSAFLAFWDRLPQELALAISTAIGVEVSKLMTAVRERRRR